jgi:tetratricopeptide (TPR) repeat protein
MAEIRELADQRRWPELAGALEAVPESRLLEVPEFAVLYADALWRVGRAEESVAFSRRGVPVLRRLHERKRALRLTNIVGIALFELGEAEAAAETFEELLELANEGQEHDFAARASNNLGVHASLQNRYDLALVHYERALASYIRLGSLRGVAQTHYNLGVNYRELGFCDKAESHYRQAMSYGERAKSEDVVGLAESDRGLLGIQMGDPQLGRVFADRARERFRRLGDPVREGEAMRVLGMAALADGARPEALRQLDAALEIGRRHLNRLLVAEVQLERGKLLRRDGETGAARDALRDAAEQFQALGAEARASAALEQVADLERPGADP